MGAPLVTGLALALMIGIAMLVAVYFVIDGLTTLFASSAVEQGKGLVIFNGIVTLLLGIMIWRGWPVSGVWAIGILDASPGAVGHQHYFIFLGGIALTGMLVSAGLIWLNRSKTACSKLSAN